jgi:glycosyltransferase involved in cell wall biosynthesis
VIRVLSVSHTGGIGPFQGKFAALASRPGIELTVLAPSRWVENYKTVHAVDARLDGYTLRTGPMIWPGYENRAFFTGGIRRAILDSKPDVLHLWEEPFSFIMFQVLVLARALCPNARVIFSTSDDLSRGFRYPYRGSWLYGHIERFSLRRSDAATVINRAVEELLREKGFRGPVEWVPHGLDLDSYPCSLAERAATPSRTRTVGYLGKLTHQKGVDVLLRALDIVARGDERSPWRVEVVGDGPERGRLQSLATELGLANRISFLPGVLHPDVPSVLRGFDVLVLPSRTTSKAQEHFGRILIEGMAAGCVVIGTDSGAIPEVIGNAGIVVPEENPTALSAAISLALGEEETSSRLRLEGRERVRRQFTWDAIAAQLHELYRHVLKA